MTEEDFFKRWSRRKHEVAKEEVQKTRALEPPAQTLVPADEKPEVPFDPASLPPLESITQLTDIKAFLREGVPVDLTRAALRRVWTADPAIRDFVGLAENAWDFTDPNAMPGFGPLEATEDVRRLIAQVVSEVGQSAQLATADARAVYDENSNHSNAVIAESDQAEPAGKEQPKQVPVQDHGKAPVSQMLPHSNKDDSAPQRDATEERQKPKQISHRNHGGALPR
jgi:hypothetical protein